MSDEHLYNEVQKEILGITYNTVTKPVTLDNTNKPDYNIG